MKTASQALLERARKLKVSVKRAARRRCRTVISDGLVIAGGLVACHALFLVWRPLGFLGVSALLVGAGLMAAKPARPRRSPDGEA